MMELMVLIRLTASAPPLLAARAGLADVGDVGRELHDHRQPACTACTRRVTISMYSGTWPTAAPMPRSLMPCGQPKFSSMPSPPVSSTRRQDAPSSAFFARHHERHDHGAVGPVALDLGDLAQVQLQRPVGDELDVVEADHAPVGVEQRAVARAVDVDDRRAVFAQRLPDHAAPAGLEGAVDVVGLVGGRRGGQPEGVGAFDAGESGAQIGHGVLHVCGGAQAAVRRA